MSVCGLITRFTPEQIHS